MNKISVIVSIRLIRIIIAIHEIWLLMHTVRMYYATLNQCRSVLELGCVCSTHIDSCAVQINNYCQSH